MLVSPLRLVLDRQSAASKRPNRPWLKRVSQIAVLVGSPASLSCCGASPHHRFSPVYSSACSCIDNRLTGSTTFRGNTAYWGGAIYSGDIFTLDDDPPLTTTTYPDDAVFIDNSAEVRRAAWILRCETDEEPYPQRRQYSAHAVSSSAPMAPQPSREFKTHCYTLASRVLFLDGHAGASETIAQELGVDSLC